MTQRYAHLSPHYMAGAVGKLDGVFAGVIAEKAQGEAALVPVESPLFDVVPGNQTKLQK